MNPTALAVAAATMTMVMVDTPAAAEPPRNALALSEVLASIEAQPGFVRFDEVEWDSDGYWEVEFYDMSGRKQEIRVDPVTGEPLLR